MKSEAYIHGYSEQEQARLLAQGKVLSTFIFDKINLSPVNNLLEVGMGVGAMTLEILARYPDQKITGIEIASSQIKQAENNLKPFLESGQVSIIQADARQTNLPTDKVGDGAFLCWVLEHIPEPEQVLAELFRILPPGSPIFITEVFHNSLHLFPSCPNIMKYWQKAIDFQAQLKGDANVGHRLGNMLHETGFEEITVQPYPMFWDKRNRANRKKLLEYWQGLMYSALASMLEVNYIPLELWHLAEAEIIDLQQNDEAIFYYSFIQAQAKTPL